MPSRKQSVFYILLTAAMLLKFFPFGPVYYRYLDDYNAYGLFYHLLRGGETPLALYMRYGLYTSRPLAGLADVLLAAPLWQSLWLVLLMMIILHAATLPLLDAAFDRLRLPWGPAASLAFGLYPLLAEGAYWINAALRIVPGFFFLALSVFFLTRYLSCFEHAVQYGKTKTPRVYDLPGAIAAGVLSLGFYEQTATFGAALFLIVVWKYRAALKGKRAAFFAWPVVYAGMIGGYYALFIRAGRMAERSAIASKPLLTQARDTLVMIKRLLYDEQRYNLVELFKTELPRFFKQPSGYIFLLIGGLALSIALALVLYKDADDAAPREKSRFDSRTLLYPLISMGLLFLAAFGPFFLLQSSFLKLRNLFFVVPVLAMAVQLLWNAASRHRIAKTAACAAAGAMVFGCLLLNAGSVNAFRMNEQNNQTVANHILNTLHDERTPGDYRKLWLFGARYQYIRHGGVNLESSTLSDWALTGLVNVLAYEQYGERYATDDGSYYMNPVVAGWAYRLDIQTDTDLLLAVDADMNIRPLTLLGDALYYSDTGERCGWIESDGVSDWRFIPD